MTPQHWLDAWSKGMLDTLRECKGLPTIVIDSATIVPDVPGTLRLLLSTLKAAGSSPVKFFFQVFIYFFLGYFDPVNILSYSKNKQFSG